MNCQKHYHALLFGILSCALIVGFSDTALGQVSISVDHSTVNFTNIPSGAASSQQINLMTNESTTVFINTSGSPSWLTVSPGGTPNVSSAMPLALTVGVNTTTLAPGLYVGSFTISVLNNNSVTPLTVTVNLGVGGATALSASPVSLSFSTTVGTLEQNISTQQVMIASSTTALSYTVSASTVDGNNWLVPFTTSGSTDDSDIITIGVNPANLNPNTYHGSILVQSTSTSDSVAIPVTLVLAPATILSVTPSTLQPFLYQLGGTVPASQSLMVTSTNSTSVPFTVSMSPQVSWLNFPLSGATAAGGTAVAETFSVNPSGLAAGSYSTQITFTNASTGATLTPITAQFVISSNPLLSISTNSLSFVSQFGSATNPASKSVNITAAGSNTAAVGFTYSSDSTWLGVTSSGSSTPATLTISVSATGLGVGTYSGNVIVRPSNGDNYSLDIGVSLTVNNATQVTAAPGALLFSYEMTEAAPPAQLVQIAAGGQAVSFSATTSLTTTTNCPSGWLQVATSSSVTTATLTASVVATGLAAGTCSGSITVTYGTTSLAIPVTLNVSASTPLLAVSVPFGFGISSAPQGLAQLPSQDINLNSTDLLSPVVFSVSQSSNGTSPWLFVSANGDQTPQQLTVEIQPGSLSPGTYSGTITIGAQTPNLPSGVFTIPVTLTINPSITVTATGLGANNTLTFSQAGATPPAAQTITLTGSANGANFTSSIPSSSVCGWLTLSPSSGAITTGGTAVSVGVQTPSTGALVAGSYPCQFTLNFGSSATSSLTVTATLTVGAAETFTVSPKTLTFAYQIGGGAPTSQQIMVSGAPNAVNFTVGTTSGGSGWLSTDAGTGTISTPKTINVSVDPTKISAGSLVAGQSVSGTVSINAPSISASPTVVNVTVNISAAAIPSPTTIFNSANVGAFGGIAPGELITIKGVNLGPATPVNFTVAANNTVTSTLGGVQVFFDSTPGTPTYVSATQINVIVPWEVAGRAQTTITVAYNGGTSAGFQYNVVSAFPAFYTLNSTGTGQAAALNSDYSINGPTAGVLVGTTTIPTKPASPGSEIAIYGTGGGITNPGGSDGTISPSTILYPLANWTQGSSIVTATIGGQAATVDFIGAAPSEVTGVFQVNLTVPTGVTGDALPVAITINGVGTYAGPTISVH